MTKHVTIGSSIAYAAPSAGSYFFYIAMWSIVPGVYGEYFGLPLTSIAAVVLIIRLFDGVIDISIGYLSDWRRSLGGSRKPWVLAGGIGSVIACYFLFVPPMPVRTAYYLAWSMAYFLAFTIAEIPHLTWGSELTMDYRRRARVFGIRNAVARTGICVFYALPLLGGASSAKYTPQVLQSGIHVGALLTAIGLIWALAAAPAGVPPKIAPGDNWRLLLRSLTHNKPLLLYFAAFGCIGLSVGMWSALLFFYLDSYLGLGERVAVMLLVASVVAGAATPLCLTLIHRTSKSTAWAVGVLVFLIQLIGMLFLAPGGAWWLAFGLVIFAHMCFCCHDIAALSILGDIIDYGNLKFHRDRGATYFGLNTLIFKFGIGIGGGMGLGIAGLLGFNPAQHIHSSASILGLKLGFIVLPACFALLGLLMILRTPITRRRHLVIQRRLEARVARAAAHGLQVDTKGLLIVLE